MTLTLLLSRRELPAGWQAALWQQIPRPEQLHLFCLAQATHLLCEDFSFLPPGRRVYCAYSHRLLGASPPPEGFPFEAGGLATLGALVRDSHGTISLPYCHWPGARGELGLKSMGIFLGDELDAQKEAIRLATGMAGCDHAVTLYTPVEPEALRMLLPETDSLLEALMALGAAFKLVSPDTPVGKHAVLLQL
ncbi:MAG: hypothetical protein HQL87_04805 [Magnetococcales bacterium]|nr:hypothetical protein [Magnetococcales bacterium]